MVGANAAKIAAGMGARVILMDISLERLRYLAEVMPANVTPLYCDSHMIREHLRDADLVIGAVLIPGSKSPMLVAREDLALMKPGTVVVDVAIDQGGCFETSRPTTHQEPTYTVDDIVHYCVTNMPGAVSRTSTIALSNATLPYVVQIANQGYERAAENDPGLGEGISLVCGRVTDAAVARSHSLSCEPRLPPEIVKPPRSHCAKRPNRKSERSCRVRPSIARSARTSPTRLQNLNPCPENPAAIATRGFRGRRSIIKCSSGEFVNMHDFIDSTGPLPSGKYRSVHCLRVASSCRFGVRSISSGSTTCSR